MLFPKTSLNRKCAVLLNFLNITLISLLLILLRYLRNLSHLFLIYYTDFSDVPPTMKYHARKNQIYNLFLLPISPFMIYIWHFLFIFDRWKQSLTSYCVHHRSPPCSQLDRNTASLSKSISCSFSSILGRRNRDGGGDSFYDHSPPLPSESDIHT